MWTSTLDLDPKRVLLTRLLGRFWGGAPFASFAPLQVNNLPRQALPAPNWVRVRNRLSGICGSDLHLVTADGDLRVAPATLAAQGRFFPGHEVVGEVLEVGEQTSELQVGDRVVLQYSPNCRSTGSQPLCRACAAGNYNLCERGTLPGPHPYGGGWSEEMLLHEQQLFRIPDSLTDEQAMMLEPTSVALHTVLRALPQRGDRVLIIGAGTIGLLTLQVVRALAPQTEISVLARHSFQVEQATRMGAAHIIYPQDSYKGVQRATNARLYSGHFGNKMLLGGYDVIFDTVGSTATLHHGLRWVRAQGSLVLVGLHLHMMHIDLSPVWFQEINLLGSFSHGLETWPPTSEKQITTFALAAELITAGQLHPETLITHRFAVNHYQDALRTALHKEKSRAIKVAFDYSLLPATVVPNIRASARSRSTLTSTIATKEQSPASTPLLPETAAITPAPLPSALDEDDDLEDTMTAIPVVKKPLRPASTPKPAARAKQEERVSIQKQVRASVPLKPFASQDVEKAVVEKVPAQTSNNHRSEPPSTPEQIDAVPATIAPEPMQNENSTPVVVAPIHVEDDDTAQQQTVESIHQETPEEPDTDAGSGTMQYKNDDNSPASAGVEPLTPIEDKLQQEQPVTTSIPEEAAEAQSIEQLAFEQTSETGTIAENTVREEQLTAPEQETSGFDLFPPVPTEEEFLALLQFENAPDAQTTDEHQLLLTSATPSVRQSEDEQTTNADVNHAQAEQDEALAVSTQDKQEDVEEGIQESQESGATVLANEKLAQKAAPRSSRSHKKHRKTR